MTFKAATWITVTAAIGGLITHSVAALISAAGIATVLFALYTFREHQLRRELLACLGLPGSSRTESLSSLLDAVRYRLHHSGNPATSSPHFSPAASIETSFDCLGASSWAIVEGSAATRAAISSAHALDSKAEVRLKYLAQPFLDSGADIGFGLRDESAQSGVLSSWLSFGYAFTLTQPISANTDGSPQRALLWIGFRNGPPTPSAIEAVMKFVEVHGPQRHSRERIAALNRAADLAKIENDEKSQFIAQLSHDLRSPLANIRSILTLLRIEQRQSEREELIEIALANCGTLGEITESVLDLTKHSAGKLSARPEAFDVRDLLREITGAFAISARLKSLDLHQRDEALSSIVLFDRGHLKRILSNVLSNAIKYTRSGSITLSLSQGNARLIIEVRDTGCGMSADELGKLFTPFSRFQGETIDGVGLGLAVSKLLAELNGGSISASSIPNSGSAFFISVPEAAAATQLASKPIPSFTKLDGLVTLIVDDDPDFVISSARILEQHGVRVLKAYSSADALSVLNFELPDCIISDANMPGGGAKQLLKGVAERRWKLPCLVLTGQQDSSRERELLALGCSRMLAKPASTEEILGWLAVIRESRGCAQFAVK